jgi:acetyltransferase-like isoleucine patch superfamily enzyme
MSVRDLVPEPLVHYIRMLQAKCRYSGATIWSGWIAPTARIGVGCLIAHEVEIGPTTEIGDFSYVNRGTIIASGSIGKFCSIGYYCQIGMPEHPIGFASTSPATYGSRNIFGRLSSWNDYPQPPLIGSDVWIGSGAHILQAVTIGNGATIAAGAVVTKDVLPYSIVAGVPARAIRSRFSSQQVEALEKLQWWDLPLDQLHKNADLFGTAEWNLLATELVGRLGASGVNT